MLPLGAVIASTTTLGTLESCFSPQKSDITFRTSTSENSEDDEYVDMSVKLSDNSNMDSPMWCWWILIGVPVGLVLFVIWLVLLVLALFCFDLLLIALWIRQLGVCAGNVRAGGIRSMYTSYLAYSTHAYEKQLKAQNSKSDNKECPSDNKRTGDAAAPGKTPHLRVVTSTVSCQESCKKNSFANPVSSLATHQPPPPRLFCPYVADVQVRRVLASSAFACSIPALDTNINGRLSAVENAACEAEHELERCIKTLEKSEARLWQGLETNRQLVRQLIELRRGRNKQTKQLVALTSYANERRGGVTQAAILSALKKPETQRMLYKFKCDSERVCRHKDSMISFRHKSRVAL